MFAAMAECGSGGVDKNHQSLVKMLDNVTVKAAGQRPKKQVQFRSKSVSHIDDCPEPDWTEFEKTYASELVPESDEEQKTEHFLRKLVDILVDYIRKNVDRSQKVVDFHHPHQLREILDHCIDIPEDPQPLEQILSDCKETLKYGVKTGHPRFFNQLSSGLDVVSMVGDWLTATTNTNMFTYEVAPVFTLMEDIVLTKMRHLIGWEEGDGIFAPGGAISNLYAVHVARQQHLPTVKASGLHGGPRLVIFTSEHSHFSFKRAGVVLGLGSDNVVSVKADGRGKMIMDDLEVKIQTALKDGAQPFFVNATGCTTVYGSIDPMDDIADMCEKYKLWMHVDAAWGGGLLLSRRHRHKFDGIERADSVTWNPHKMMGATLQCSAILLRHQGMLAEANSMCANYLFQQDKNYDVSYDTGDKAIQCGRHNDVFKLWLMWRAKGDKGMEYQINHIFEMSRYLVDQIKPRDDFELLLEDPESTNVCFWYIPPKLSSMVPGKKRDEELNKVAPQIKTLMMEKGNVLVGYQPIEDKPNFFRMVVTNPAARKEDIDYLIDEIVRLGKEI